jgi:NADPH:quinone reductase-like Zn-dependent oxidoreductase
LKAITVTGYGGSDVLQIKEVPTPSPEENEVLIRIHASAVNNTDPVFRKGRPYISRLFTNDSKTYLETQPQNAWAAEDSTKSYRES